MKKEKIRFDAGYGLANSFWINLLNECEPDEEKEIRARLKKANPEQYKEFQEIEKLRRKQNNY
ncbi:hypothetical protein [uncultured Methanobrevibacter sp.]|uniref:hypothetical protein n=1 Tax=uncultured Methanobrevibacter sp. TaxID=253161 RepID=UPI002629827B